MLYNREIKYAEYWQDGEKKAGCGFVKICRESSGVSVELTLQGLFCEKDYHYPVILYQGNEQLELGRISLHAGNGKFQRTFRASEKENGQVEIGQWDEIRVRMTRGEMICRRDPELIKKREMYDSISDSPKQQEGYDGTLNCLPEKQRKSLSSHELIEQQEGSLLQASEQTPLFTMEATDCACKTFRNVQREESAQKEQMQETSWEEPAREAAWAEQMQGTSWEEPTRDTAWADQMQGISWEEPTRDTAGEEARREIPCEKQVQETSHEKLPMRNAQEEELTMEDLETGKETKMQNAQMIPREEKWQQLTALYLHVRPFRDSREYLTLRPADFVLLSEDSYRKANNSFMLHGYYNYHHLLLARMESKGEIAYFLGTPGNFFEREKQAAILFGYESFECETEPAKAGDFGYYMMRVQI